MIEKGKLGHYRINSKDDWWQLFSEHEGEIRDILMQFCMHEKDARREKENCDINKLAPGGEYWGLNIYGIYDVMMKKFVKRLDETVADKDETVLLSMLNQAWWRAPDNGRIHDIEGWDVLCDLCSECDALRDDEPEEMEEKSE